MKLQPILSTVLITFLFVSEVSAAPLLAGVARADITPPVGSQMYGYGARGANVSEGVHDRLFAKAIVLDDGETKIALATLDLGAFYAENTNAVREIVEEQTGIENVLCAVSHTHSAPVGTLAFPTREAPWIAEAEGKIAASIVEAANNLQPVKIGVGWGEAREGHNRRMVRDDGRAVMLWENRARIPTEPVDYSVGVISVRTEDGDALATLVNFTCHPVVLGPENLQISADYPGEMMKEVEEALGGRCMFLQGAAGNINPFWDKTAPEDGAFEQMERMGETIAQEVIRVSRGIVGFDSDLPLSFHTEAIPLSRRFDLERGPESFEAQINTVLVGKDIAFGFFPGEFFVEHGLSLKNRSKYLHTFFVGYTNDALRYFPTINALVEGGYGADEASVVEVGAGELLVNHALINLYKQGNRFAPIHAPAKSHPAIVVRPD